ncbi:unnamed protein product, partial [Alternaria alternata]
MQTLLTVPITIREQIYHELLTYIPSETATKDVAPSSPICKLLALNRQINTEVSPENGQLPDLRKHWQRQGSAGYYLLKIDMFMRNVNSDTPENTVIQYKMVCTFGPKGLEVADASDSVALLQEARKVAEEMISFLSDKPYCAQEESMTSDAVQIPVRKQKFLMSFKAHIVCKALGD